jgi:hypothetical protein
VSVVFDTSVTSELPGSTASGISDSSSVSDMSLESTETAESLIFDASGTFVFDESDTSDDSVTSNVFVELDTSVASEYTESTATGTTPGSDDFDMSRELTETAETLIFDDSETSVFDESVTSDDSGLFEFVRLNISNDFAEPKIFTAPDTSDRSVSTEHDECITYDDSAVFNTFDVSNVYDISDISDKCE